MEEADVENPAKEPKRRENRDDMVGNCCFGIPGKGEG